MGWMVAEEWGARFLAKEEIRPAVGPTQHSVGLSAQLEVAST
jgi:hypothetical protein